MGVPVDALRKLPQLGRPLTGQRRNAAIPALIGPRLSNRIPNKVMPLPFGDVPRAVPCRGIVALWYPRSTSVVPPLYVRITSDWLTEVKPRYNGGTTEVLRRYQRDGMVRAAGGEGEKGAEKRETWQIARAEVRSGAGCFTPKKSS